MNSTLTELRPTTPWLLHVSTDIVIFAVRDEQMRVLLRQRYSDALDRHSWALPGGYLKPTEPLEDCARRTLNLQTGIKDLYLEQLYTFGRPDRHPKSRVITVSYYALIPYDHPQARPETQERLNVEWHNVDDLPTLYLDHAEIVELARQRLVAKLNYSTIAFQLMPDKFTLSELQNTFEIILGEALDKRNFRKRILAQEIIEDTGEFQRLGSHRPARLYRYTSPGEVYFTK